jgi:hypothetical protein
MPDSLLAEQYLRTLGLEDLRLVFVKHQTGHALCATASAMRNVVIQPVRGWRMSALQPGSIEVVSVVFGRDEDNFVSVKRIVPMRGPWSTGHQKNWSPFVLADENAPRAPYCLYSPLGGGVHGIGDNGFAPRLSETHEPPTLDALGEKPDPRRKISGSGMSRLLEKTQAFRSGSMGVKISPSMHGKAAPERLALRGGTQLVRMTDGAGPWHERGYAASKQERSTWLGLAHACEVGTEKLYWHRFYSVDSFGELLALSAPFKISPAHGIEFAAGLARVGNDYVISYGIEDESSWIGCMSMEQAHAMLKPLA